MAVGDLAELSNLENYVDAPADGKVVAWPTSRTEPDRAGGNPGIEFTVTAQVLRETEEGREARLKREEDARLREEEEAKLKAEEEEEAKLKAEEEEKDGLRDGESDAAKESEGQVESGEEIPAESSASAEPDKDEL